MKVQRLRLWIQIFFVALIVFISVGHYLDEKNIYTIPGVASIHAICPFGGVVTMYNFVTTGDYVKKLHQSNFIMILALIILLVLTGASFCGWICPLGSVQEWFGKLGRKIFRKHYNKVPKKLDKVLRFGKYFVLGYIVIQTARTVNLVFADFDPYYNLFNIWTDEIALSGYIVVALTLGLSLLIERPFCRYACPLGAINGLFNSFSLLNIKRYENTCVNCGQCDRACPVGIVVSKTDALRSPSCIRCLKCVESCPINEKNKDTLKLDLIPAKKEKKPRKVIPNTAYVVLVLVAFIAPIAIAMANGAFITERIKTYETTDDIRGSSTLQEILDHYDVSKGVLYGSLGIPQSIPTETKLKDLAELIGIPEEEEIISPEVIRTAVEVINQPVEELYSVANIDSSELSEIIKNAGLDEGATVKQLVMKSEPGVLAYIISGKWPSDYIAQTGEDELVYQPEKETTEVSIKGSTTLGEIKELVPDFEAFLQEFGISEDEPLTAMLKDLKSKYGFEISAIREYVDSQQ
ncbi:MULTISPECIES: 4Fe-4S binding protein [Kosmotoga]|uniref:4Fe-4S ferredoxin iron-sulfur binding domain protein n=1 Tax=Kosmotoga olearia (strain ATCC BAA-1733 / DSM 21960 / TBF 19.5.1) TaxID=521045 RepID=C5CDV9_KOSOT|nr:MULTISPECIES: 4Fe-4S binding protein [Kosmotoga]ACR79128.1 4Fe-4S ferredoxin iron-sulfur binding domain protein [Kosmotoga olearia TBF 19.5.1]MDI3523608.1 hypothetical protein [Kosmotoga sp.]MDK2953144.1 hypothetical protein [Kosmotoga sp.]OAA23822.1 4Fe-4S ferredoxin [Kosmotoga sp. DU53]